jgi:UDP-glucuronate decarboxylase
MIELANEVLLQTKSTSKIIYTDLPVDDPQQRKPDISKAKSKLDWEPQFNLENGIKLTILYFKGLLRK